MAVTTNEKSTERVYFEKLADHELIFLYLLGPGSQSLAIQNVSRSDIVNALQIFVRLPNADENWCQNSLKEALSFDEIKEIIGVDDSIRFLCFKYKPFELFISLKLEQIAYISVNKDIGSKQEKISFLQKVSNDSRKLKEPADLKFVTNNLDLTIWALNYISKYHQTSNLSETQPHLKQWHSKISDINQVEAKILIDTLISQIVSINTFHPQNSQYSEEDKQRLYELERRELVAKLKSAYTRRKSRTNKNKETKEFSFTMNRSIQKKLSELSVHEGKTKSAIIEELVTKAYRTMKKQPSVLGED